jgi:16S rRNA (uracil1498-N3)-methyltransferase
MNRMLLEKSDVVAGDGLVTLNAQRTKHLREVLRASVGTELRAGIVDGGTGRVVVERLDEMSCCVRFVEDPLGSDKETALRDLTVVMAIPRPKVLRRVIESVASFGVKRVVLTNSWRVDKAYLLSPELSDAAIRKDCIFGAEQGGHTRLPAITIYSRLMQMFETEFAVAARNQSSRVVAHPEADVDLCGCTEHGLPSVIAIGPEGGWIDRELQSFADVGFTKVWLSSSILRVETAIAVALGQLELLATSRTLANASGSRSRE